MASFFLLPPPPTTTSAVEDSVDAGKPPSRSVSPRISKQDISNPTKTTGPLFKTGTSLDSDEEDNLLNATVSERRAKVSGVEWEERIEGRRGEREKTGRWM